MSPKDDLDDLLDFDSPPKEDGEKAESDAAPKPEPPKQGSPAAPPPSAPPSATDDKLLSDFGDFDALFGKAEAAPPPAPEKAPGVDDLLADFGLDQTEAPVQGAPPAPESSAPKKVEDLFDDFVADPKSQSKTQPQAKPPPIPKPSGKTSAKPEISKPEEALEELFSEVSEANAEIPESSGEMMEGNLGIEYKKKKTRKIPKPLVMGVPAFLVVVALTALVMARFTSTGFFGWKFGQKAKDAYEPATGSVLKRLDGRYNETLAFFQPDLIEDYKKAKTELESILRIDAHHSPTEARLAETLLLISDRALTSTVRKQVQGYVDQSNQNHPEVLVTIRAKARFQMADGQYASAETVGRRALNLNPKDVETLTLLGEIAIYRSDLDSAAKYLTQAVEANANWPRAQHFFALTKLSQGNVEEAEKILRNLVDAKPSHLSSEIDLWRVLYTNRSKVDEAREGLKKFIETQAGAISSYDLGRAWKSLAEVAEASKDIPGAISAMEKSAEADRSSAPNAFYLGRLYLVQKEYEKAAQEFGRASSLSPTPEYLIYEGNALREQGKLTESLSELQKGLEKDSMNIEGLYQLGLTQRALNRTDESIVSFENVLKGDPRHLDSMVNLGELYLSRDNFSMAKTHLRNAITISPQSVRAHDALGEVLFINRKWSEALAEFQAAEKVDPKNVSVLSNLGRVYLALNQIEKASSYFEKALTIDATRLETQVALGELQHRKKEYVKALETYRNVLKERPKDYDTRVKLAAVLIDQQAFQEAVTELQEASKWSPNYFPTRLNLGIAWRGLGSLDNSLEQLNLASQLRPEAADAYYQLELTHIFRNDPINAETAMEKAVNFDAKYIAPFTALGDYFDSRNLYEKAVDYYKRAEKIEPRNADVLYKLAECYRRNEKPKEAKAYFLKTVAADKRYGDAYLGLGLIAEDEGKQAQAIQYLKKAQSLDPNDPKPYYYLGFVFKDLNQKQAAAVSFRKYLQLDPNSKEKQDIEDQVYALTH